MKSKGGHKIMDLDVKLLQEWLAIFARIDPYDIIFTGLSMDICGAFILAKGLLLPVAWNGRLVSELICIIVSPTWVVLFHS